MRPASKQQQPDERCGGGQPTNGIAGQSAADAEAQETQQERQILEVGKYPNFNRQPADKRQLGEQRKKARQKKFKQTPAIAGRICQDRKSTRLNSSHPS